MSTRSATPSARKLGRPTAHERAERRELMLDTALEVFLEHGFGDTTVEQLASAAGATKRTVYSYFGDKAGMFTEMVRRLAMAISIDAPYDDDTLETLSIRIVYRLHSAELIGLHRLVIAESTRFPELAATLHDHGDARHISRLAEHLRDERELGDEVGLRAQQLFALLLGEDHRRRLLGLLGPATREQARKHAGAALGALGLARP